MYNNKMAVVRFLKMRLTMRMTNDPYIAFLQLCFLRGHFVAFRKSKHTGVIVSWSVIIYARNANLEKSHTLLN